MVRLSNANQSLNFQLNSFSKTQKDSLQPGKHFSAPTDGIFPDVYYDKKFQEFQEKVKDYYYHSGEKLIPKEHTNESQSKFSKTSISKDYSTCETVNCKMHIVNSGDEASEKSSLRKMEGSNNVSYSNTKNEVSKETQRFLDLLDLASGKKPISGYSVFKDKVQSLTKKVSVVKTPPSRSIRPSGFGVKSIVKNVERKHKRAKNEINLALKFTDETQSEEDCVEIMNKYKGLNSHGNYVVEEAHPGRRSSFQANIPARKSKNNNELEKCLGSISDEYQAMNVSIVDAGNQYIGNIAFTESKLPDISAPLEKVSMETTNMITENNTAPVRNNNDQNYNLNLEDKFITSKNDDHDKIILKDGLNETENMHYFISSDSSIKLRSGSSSTSTCVHNYHDIFVGSSSCTITGVRGLRYEFKDLSEPVKEYINSIQCDVPSKHQENQPSSEEFSSLPEDTSGFPEHLEPKDSIPPSLTTDEEFSTSFSGKSKNFSSSSPTELKSILIQDKIILNSLSEIENNGNYPTTNYPIEVPSHYLDSIFDADRMEDEANEVPLESVKEPLNHEPHSLLNVPYDEDSRNRDKLNKALISAVAKNRPPKVRELLEQKADPNTKCGFSGGTVLHQAAIKGFLYVVRALIDAGSDIEARTEVGNTPLHFAAREGHDKVIKELLFRGTDVNATNHYGVSALHFSLSCGRISSSNILLENHANTRIPDISGESCQDMANRLGYDCDALQNSNLILNPIPIDVQLILGVEEDCPIKVESCLKEGADPNTLVPLALHWPAKSTVLHRSAYVGDDVIVRLLLKAEASITGTDIVGNTPLHAASQRGCNKIVKLLIEAGSALESRSLKGMTPLHRAASKGRELTVKLLLRKGAARASQDEDGRTPADWARKRGFIDLAKRLEIRRYSSLTLLNDSLRDTILDNLRRVHERILASGRC